LKRKVYDRLLNWKHETQGKTAILLEGARRVGKSYIAEEFASHEYSSYILIDFSNISDEIRDLFEHETYNLDLFFEKISLFFGVKLIKRESLLIFDEVQMFPRARQLIKLLVGDGRFDYIETGSLISLKQNVENIVIPSEEEHIPVYPMDFEEFLWALGDEVTFPLLRDCFEKQISVGQIIHRKIMNLFRQYMLTGGMPQAVKDYAEYKDFERTDRIKRTILQLYRADVSKFAKGYESKVLAIFDEIPSQLSKHEKKFNLSSLTKGAKFRSYEDSFMWLSEAMITNNCFNSTDPNIGMGLSTQYNMLKCYMLDTGLLVTHTLGETEFTGNEIYKAILFDRLGIKEGMFLENIVAQIFRTNGKKLYFYSNSGNENPSDRLEIDFLIRNGSRISPVEVKSSDYISHTSFDRFRKKFGNHIGQPYIIYTKDFRRTDDAVCIPVYMAVFL
jgi:uncharacterized protein